jgi:hypothetical protein
MAGVPLHHDGCSLRAHLQNVLPSNEEASRKHRATAHACRCAFLLIFLILGSRFSYTAAVITRRRQQYQLNGFSYSTSQFHTLEFLGSRDSSDGIATGYWLNGRGVGVRVPAGSRIFSSPHRPDRLRGPPNLLSNGYRG